ncbi:D-alanine--D-alanine ligase [Candidatus Clostridium stratigraminis]|uniref:D-alanine--D-alanine ligase n=1 Tax=Candidatus Clostridium stratigraminis TaxID=3381661 RepID=A0ABW8SZI0_9CLOT
MRVGVIMGGTSSERDISLLTGKEILENLDKDKYEVAPILINSKKELIEKTLEEKIDFAFLALHGKFGEDGSAQAILEGLNIPYSGSGILASSLCMDKDISKRLMQSEGINTAPWVTIRKNDEINYKALEELGYPLVVKPANGGSSIGTNIVKNSEGIIDAVLSAFDFDDEVMIEKYVTGKEITCSILDGKLLPIIEIKPSSEFFDYKSKYADKGSDETIIELEASLEKVVREICIKCWNLFKCDIYGRIDMIIENSKPYVLEINTLPGMTKNSLLPKSAKAVNMDFKSLLDNIIRASLKINR